VYSLLNYIIGASLGRGKTDEGIMYSMVHLSWLFAWLLLRSY